MEKNQKRSSELLNAINLLIVLELIVIAFYAISNKGCGLHVHRLQILAVAVGIAVASLVLGGLLGFLFSIPRSGAHNEETDYPDNSNLVDVSDWLTKILVGAGLVTLTKIPPKLGALATYLGTNGLNDEKAGSVFALALLVFNGVCGFLWVYIWTRLNFHRDLSDSRTRDKLLSALRESPVAHLLLGALSLPPSLNDEEAKALRNQAEFMGRTELTENPESRKIAIQYSRLLDEQFQNRDNAMQVLKDTLAVRRKNKVPPDADDAALHYNLACYLNRNARAESNPETKQKLQSEAKEHLREALKFAPEIDSERKKDPDLNELEI